MTGLHGNDRPDAPEELVGPLVRGIAVLSSLAQAGGSARLADLAKLAEDHRATTDRVVGTLARVGAVTLDGQTATLAPGAMRLANAYLHTLGLPDLLSADLRHLASVLDVSVTVAVGGRDGTRFVAHAARPRPHLVELHIPLGARLPLHLTAAGDVLAGSWRAEHWADWQPEGLPAPVIADFRSRAAEAARRGWAVDDQRLESGLVAVAVPVHGVTGEAVAAVSAVSHLPLHSAAQLKEHALPALLTMARDTERELQRRVLGNDHAPAAPGHGGQAPPVAGPEAAPGEDYIRSLARGLAVIDAFNCSSRGLTLSEAASLTGLARATVRRSLITLGYLGLVRQQGSVFLPQAGLLDLGAAYLSRRSLHDLAQSHLDTLARQVDDSVSLAVLDGDDIRYVARAAVSRVVNVSITSGTRFPAFATAMGRVLLSAAGTDPLQCLELTARQAFTQQTMTHPGQLVAAVAEAGSQGYAIVTDELEEGLRSIAVPVAGPRGGVVAALNVAMHTSRRSVDECREEVLPRLLGAAEAITADVTAVHKYTKSPLV